MNLSPTLPDAETTDIAIIGISCRFPGANTPGQFWSNLRDGLESISFFSEEELLAVGVSPDLLRDPNYVRARGVLDGAEWFDADFFGFNPREAQITDPQHRVLLECAWEALEDAGYDPYRFDGLVGVFAGAGTNHYALNVLSAPQLRGLVSDLQIGLGNEVDFLANRISYKLNLKGPSVVVQTACSTSLVAVHLASQSLMSFECDMALVGTVSIRFPQENGYLYQEGGILSPDGHCRAFDVDSQGTVSSNGAGVLLLKRLTDALTDGDHIYAVIKGSAVNNDGALKIGYTAPSVDGQAEVIAVAQAVAGISAEDIGYIETHGTGTRLGDPIEIAALTQIFRACTKAIGFCGIGSVKTNIGHLNTAAGMAGLIKTALAFKYKQIPKSLHFTKPNPEIHFEESPFFVNTELTGWISDGKPRRAGVSSFGLGGTNAHLILEQAPEREFPRTSHRPRQLLLLSAGTASALETMTDEFSGYLRDHRDQDLADVAYTLQVGRGDFQHRRMLVCEDTQQAVALLESRNSDRLLTGQVKSRERPVVFLLSGFGDHYVGMAQGLYQHELTFRHWVDRCAEMAQPHLGLDIREVLYPALYSEDGIGGRPSLGGGVDSEPGVDLQKMLRLNGDQTDPAEGRLNQTALAHTALFIVEYALAQLLIEWGLQPEAMLGHSLGDYVAACLAGVFSLEDGLPLVVRRAQLIETLDAGAMLAVLFSEQEIEPFLNDDIHLALVNGPELCVLAGNQQAVADLQAQLEAEGRPCQRVQNAYPVHTQLMEPIVDRFTQMVDQIALKPPAIPFISNLTGDWITAVQATDPVYWGRHLSHTVRFGDGVRTLLRTEGRALLEVGPGQTLLMLVREHLTAGGHEDAPLLPTLRPVYDQRLDDVSHLLTTLGKLWLAGRSIDWEGFYAHERRCRLPLPTYPFERQRFFVEFSPQVKALQPEAITPQVIGTALVDQRPESAFLGERAEGISAVRESQPAEPILSAMPQTDMEHRVAEIWGALLGLDYIGIHDNFLELGGHSLLAVQLAGRLFQEFQVSFSLSDLLQASTVAEQVHYITRYRDDQLVAEAVFHQLPEIIPRPEERHLPFPLTEIQEAYWVGRSGDFELGTVSTHSYVEIENDIDPRVFDRAVNCLIERHEMLRAIILPDGQQQILTSIPSYRLEVVDMRGKEPQAVAEFFADLRQRVSHQVKSLDQWPLFELYAVRLDDQRTRYCLGFDLIVGDAGSWQLVFDELNQLCRDPELALEPLEFSFRDYVLAERSLREMEIYQGSLVYWRERLATLPPAPQLPLAVHPSAIDQPQFRRRTASLEQGAWARLKRLAARADLTPSGLLLAIFAEVLSAWSESPQLTINLTLFNRLPLHPQVDDLMGDFTSLILLAADTGTSDSFEERAKRLQKQLWRDLDSRYVTGVWVLRELIRLQGGAPGARMPVVFTSTLGLGTPGEEASVLAKLSQLGEVVFNITQTPQVWLDHQAFEQGGALVFNWDAIEDLFPPALLDDMFDAYCQLLRSLVDDPEAWQRGAFKLIPSRQLEARDLVNATDTPVVEELAHSAFIKQAMQRPDQLALIAPECRLTYGELYRKTNQLGRRLRELGVVPDQPVAIVMEKGWDQIVAVLGILQSGGAYLPIDPQDPQERFWHLLEAGEVQIALTQPCLKEVLSWPDGVQRLCVDDDELKEVSDSPLEPVQKPGHLAYILYTSGSTGLPKGAMIEHRSVVNRMSDVNQRFDVLPEDRALALTALHHDLSVYDIFGILAVGGALVIPAETGVRDPAHWATLIADHRVTLWNSVPTFMEMYVEYCEHLAREHSSAIPPGPRLVMLSGDWIPVTLPDRMRALWPDTRLIGLGGPTETTVWDICYPIGKIDPAWKSIPYGRPMTNARYYVLDGKLEHCPDWVPGELYIAGVGLARGYWRDEERTRASFIDHPVTGERMYRSGDMGRYLPGGDIEILGRVDFQLKIRGYRVEAGEVEAALLQHQGVKEAAVIGAGERGKQRLVAYVVMAAELDSSSAASIDDDLRRYLNQKLPSYMIPSIFVPLERIPITPSGKLDRRALPDPSAVVIEPLETVPPGETETIARISELVTTVLGVEELSPQDDFLMLGATSVDMIRIANLLDREIGYRPGIDEFYERPTVMALAASYERDKGKVQPPPVRQAPTWYATRRSLTDTYAMIFDPAEREAFKDAQPGLRRGDDDKPKVPLRSPPLTEADLRSFTRRRSFRKFTLNPIPFEQFSRLLGHLRQVEIQGVPKYLYPSAGGLYPLQTYLYVKPGRVAGLQAGTYYYHPRQDQLVQIEKDAEIDRLLYLALINRPIFDEAAVGIYFIVQLSAIAPMYGDYSMPFALLEAGYMGQLLMMVAPNHEIGLCPIGDFDFEPVRGLFDLRDDHVLVHSLLGGHIDPSQMDRLEVETHLELQGDEKLERLLHRIHDLSLEEVQQLLEANTPDGEV